MPAAEIKEGSGMKLKVWMVASLFYFVSITVKAQQSYQIDSQFNDLATIEATKFKNVVKIFEVRKNLPLSNQQKPERDYYINAGQGRGIQPGTIFKVYRRNPVYDPYYNQLAADLRLEVAELLVLYATQDLSIARLAKIAKNPFRPILDFNAPMVGDEIDLKSVRTPASLPTEPDGLGDLKYLNSTTHHQIQKQMAAKALAAQNPEMAEQIMELVRDNPPPSPTVDPQLQMSPVESVDIGPKINSRSLMATPPVTLIKQKFLEEAPESIPMKRVTLGVPDESHQEMNSKDMLPSVQTK